MKDTGKSYRGCQHPDTGTGQAGEEGPRVASRPSLSGTQFPGLQNRRASGHQEALSTSSLRFQEMDLPASVQDPEKRGGEGRGGEGQLELTVSPAAPAPG